MAPWDCTCNFHVSLWPLVRAHWHPMRVGNQKGPNGATRQKREPHGGSHVMVFLSSFLVVPMATTVDGPAERGPPPT